MRKYVWSLFGVLILAASLTFGTEALAKSNEEPVFEKGLFVESVDISGMTKTEALKAIDAYVAELSQKTIALTAEEQQVEVNMESLGLSYTNPEILEEALTFGKTGNLIKRYKERKDLEHEPKIYKLAFQVDRAKVVEVVDAECGKFDVEAKNASLKKTGNGFEIIPGVTGVLIDREASADAIVEYVANEWNEETANIELSAKVDEPQGTKEELSKVKDLLGSFTTSYKTSGASRSKNVETGASHINGSVLYPGEELSVYQVVSPFTAANGYAMAGSYLNGKTVDSMGGGICQVSTTLYNAALRAELEITERSPHSMLVGYVDPSADAAIAGTFKDLKFKNNTDAPIYIEGYTQGKNITFNIYGQETRPANRTIKFVSKTLSTTDPGTVLVADGGQGLGYRRVESAHVGKSAELYKHVYVDGKEVSVEKVNKSKYNPSPRTIIYGIVGDPDLSNQIQAAIALQDEAAANAVQSAALAAISQ